jgi:hypothetical protein
MAAISMWGGSEVVRTTPETDRAAQSSGPLHYDSCWIKKPISFLSFFFSSGCVCRRGVCRLGVRRMVPRLLVALSMAAGSPIDESIFDLAQSDGRLLRLLQQLRLKDAI